MKGEVLEEPENATALHIDSIWVAINHGMTRQEALVFINHAYDSYDEMVDSQFLSYKPRIDRKIDPQ